ncbi:MAG: bifunctional 2-C-methyl-D-erythritol 4-phosphate cytidylyltransferase/2-C-methyl-D-erythritol 2,4-cyclodiphosphate synthase [Rhodospirillales bacterium]|nr:MAG: bifunctional 2-C-methyl-D-erythritol 4-phosphate cytidylyltransferase/2-C-methyl-D-erythritol 2,4-cyclodiphosphate synthase [Rhodospirillales bacterium]
MADAVVLIIAAGRGHRAGGGTPKQYRMLAGQTVLRRSCMQFLAHPRIDAVGTVIHPDDHSLYESATAGLGLLPPIDGGDTRLASCRNGLEAIAADPPRRVLLHDAARPLVGRPVIDRVLEALETAPAAIPAIPVSDTLKRADAFDRVTATLPRDGLWRAQTPQGFDYAAILEAYRQTEVTGLTDDAAVAEAAGLPVQLVAGEEANLKITREDDFRRAESLLSGQGDIRVGTGFDIHRFVEGNGLQLCGIWISHDKGVAGHSDADVALHALTDAVLGAVAEADIGTHFPPSDPQWQGADSAMFLSHAASLVAARGGEIAHLDVTLICEAPKIGPHRDAMRARIGEIAGLTLDRVSVKATTAERLGFIGRGDGIAAQAVATVRL